jgi:hypothetical protein
MEHTLGSMGGNTPAPGRTTTCMAMVCTLGKMVEDTKATMKWIRSMATECINGQMEEDMKAIGSMGNSMDRVGIFYRTRA